jgi:hypothetical protein
VTELYRRRVKHDADGGTEGLGRQVGPELGANDTAVSVRPGDLAPDDADLGALDGPLSAVDVCRCVNVPPLLLCVFRAQWNVHATRFPQYQFAAAVLSTPSSFNSDVPGLVLRFLRIVSGSHACIAGAVVPSLVAAVC